MTRLERLARALCEIDKVDPDGLGVGMGFRMLKDTSYPLWEARVPVIRAMADLLSQEGIDILRD